MNASAGLSPFNTVFSDDLHGRRYSWASLGSLGESSTGPGYSATFHDVDQRQRRHSVSTHAYRTHVGSCCQLAGYVNQDIKRKIESKLSDSSSKTKIRINVRGQKYETYKSTLEQFPETLLGSYGGRCPYYDSINEELCFNRDPNSFDAILFFYQSGGSILARPSSVDEDLFADEVKFFGLFEERNEQRESQNLVQEEIFTGHFVNLRIKMWNIFERPAACRFGRTFARVSIIFILLSVMAFCLETIPALQRLPFEKPATTEKNSFINVAVKNFGKTFRNRSFPNAILHLHNYSFSSLSTNSTRRKQHNKTRDEFFLKNHTESETNDGRKAVNNPDEKWKFWFYLDTVFVAFFTAEYIARIFSSPNRLKCIRSFLSVVDFCAIAPYYISHIAQLLQAEKIYNARSFNVLRSIRLFRVVRLFKLSRHSSGLKLLGRALYLSRGKMVSLMCCIIMAIVFFSGLMFYIEGFGEFSMFESIPHAFWWSIVTMSTVGYGDVVPRTALGKLVGAFCALTGIILLFILPIPSFVTDFSKLYEQLLRRRRRARQKEETQVRIHVTSWGENSFN
jgi:voltage-gated potassium channel Kch